MFGPVPQVVGVSRIELLSMYAEDTLLSEERLRSHRLLEIPRMLLEYEDSWESVIDKASYIDASEWWDGDKSSKREQSNSNVVGDEEDCGSGGDDDEIQHREDVKEVGVSEFGVRKFILQWSMLGYDKIKSSTILMPSPWRGRRHHRHRRRRLSSIVDIDIKK